MTRHRLLNFGLAAAAALYANVAAAQGTTSTDDGTTLGNCMVEHHTAEHEHQFKTMLVDALTDNTEGLNKSALAMGMGSIMLATQECGLKMTDLQSPHFKKAAEIYGEAIATKIFGAAMAKIGIED